MRFLRYIFFVIFCFLLTTPTSAQPACPARPVCIVDREWTIQELQQRLRGANSTVFVEGDEISFFYHGEAQSLWLTHSISSPMWRIENSNYWAITLQVERLPEAIISYAFAVNGRTATETQTWRGQNAPLPPGESHPLRGTLETLLLHSEALNGERGVTIYLPPNHNPNRTYPVLYAADGLSVMGFAPVVETLILDGTIPPLIMVGIHSSEFRMEEYLPGYNSQRFSSHEAFFTQEVRHWAENTLGASDNRNERIVMGFSNGGVFATAMALSHSDIYGTAFPFSAGINPLPQYPGQEPDPTQNLFFTAGTLEVGFYRTTTELADIFARAGATVVFSERVAGHDWELWREELVQALKWRFETGRRLVLR